MLMRIAIAKGNQLAIGKTIKFYPPRMIKRGKLYKGVKISKNFVLLVMAVT